MRFLKSNIYLCNKNNMEYKNNFYLWIIDQLSQRSMTFDEIKNEWDYASVNYEHRELTKRSFHRYKLDILSIYGADIVCNERNDYKYSLERNPYEDNELTEWMLSAFRISSLAQKMEYSSKVLIENPPRNSEILNDVMYAIDKHFALQFHYNDLYGRDSDIILLPAFVRLFHQRWYVIGEVYGKKHPRSFAFDRITDFDVIYHVHNMTKDMAKLLNPDSYYEDCYGIINISDLKPIKIRFRAFWPQNKIVDETPIHSSQHKVYDGGEKGYCDYDMTVKPTRDLKQELLWHGRNIIIISPDSLKQEMMSILDDMHKSYETGENYTEER